VIQFPDVPEGPAGLVAIVVLCATAIALAGILLKVAQTIRDTLAKRGANGSSPGDRIMDRIDNAERALTAAIREVDGNVDATRHEMRNHQTAAIGYAQEALRVLDAMKQDLVRGGRR
jgi:hypothetical protein